MIKAAVRSLKKDLDRAVFYWIVFVMSSGFMFSFFHLALSDAIGVTFINSNNDLPTYLTVIDVSLCIVVIFLANDFYVKKKSEELAVILICGGTYLQLVEFLLFQTGILMAVSIPVGVGLGYLCFPVLSFLLKFMSEYEVHFTFGVQSVALTVCVIVSEVFWCTMLNLGYAYRNSIYTLLEGEEKIKIKMPRVPLGSKIRWIYPILYFGGAVLVYTCKNGPERMPLLGFAGMIGMWGMINQIILPWLERGVSRIWIDDSEKLVYMGYFREDLKMIRLYIGLFITTVSILCTLMAGTVRHSGEFALSLLSFAIIIPLLALSLMFRFAAESAGRKRQFDILFYIGYTRDQITRMKHRELICLYGFIMAVSMVYILNIVIALCLFHLIPAGIGGMIVLIFTASMIICGTINGRQYEKNQTG